MLKVGEVKMMFVLEYFELRGVVGVILGLLLSVLRGSVLRVVECV